MSAWWRRNAVPLAALVVLVPLAIGSIGWQEWRTYYEGRHWQAMPVEDGAWIELGGARIGQAALRAAPAGAGIDTPPGARALAAELTVVPGDEPVTCSRPRLVERATGRTWEAEYAPIGWHGESSCFESRSPVVLRVPFVVPEDAGPFAIELEVLHDGSQLPRFLVDGP